MNYTHPWTMRPWLKCPQDNAFLGQSVPLGLTIRPQCVSQHGHNIPEFFCMKLYIHRKRDQSRCLRSGAKLKRLSEF
jgi:hypothetical protein